MSQLDEPTIIIPERRKRLFEPNHWCYKIPLLASEYNDIKITINHDSNIKNVITTYEYDKNMSNQEKVKNLRKEKKNIRIGNKNAKEIDLEAELRFQKK